MRGPPSLALGRRTGPMAVVVGVAGGPTKVHKGGHLPTEVLGPVMARGAKSRPTAAGASRSGNDCATGKGC